MTEPAKPKNENHKLRILIRNCLVFSLIWHLVAAWFSVGYHQADEHYQVLEFAAWKMGHAPLSTMPWEFAQRIRPAIQPAMVVVLQKYIWPFADPFQAAFLIRLLSALFGFGSMVFILGISLKMVENNRAKRFLVLFTTLLWFAPYMHAHFSADSFSGALFAYGLGCILLARQKGKNYLFLPGGLLVGLAIVVRLQTGLMVLGLAIWCIFIVRMKFRHLILIALPVLIALAIGLLIDKWFYDEWVITAINYFRINIIQGKASEFGVLPWYAYFSWNFLDLIPPFSLLIMAGVLYALYKYRTHIYSLSIILFLIVHIVINHKEPRFLFPVVSFIPLLVTFAYRDFKLKNEKTNRILINIFWGINILMMAFVCIKPANDRIGLFAYIYHHYTGAHAILICNQASPYHFDQLRNYYYRPADLVVYDSMQNNQIDSIAQHAVHPVLVYFDDRQKAAAFQSAHPVATRIFNNFPDWIRSFNYFHWLERTKNCTLYRLK